MSRELMQQALEALEFEASGWEDVPPITREAITALRQALSEQPAHQEVDWEKLYRLEFKKKEALAAKYERDIKPLTKIVLMKQPAQQQEPVGDDRVMTVVYRNVQKEDVQSFTDHPKAVWFGWCHAPYQRDDAIFKLEKAINALRQALDTEQEPVISTDHGPWIPSTHPREEGETYCKRCLLRDKFFGSRQCDPHIVYTAPQKREWVGLTDEEIEDLIYVSQKIDASSSPWFDRLGFAKAIEEALKEKNA